MIWAFMVITPAIADDTELFVGDASQFPQVTPNILFVIDTSGSMDTAVQTQAAFDPAVTYTGSCDPTRVYWRNGTGTPPDCSTDQWTDANTFVCQRALNAFASTGSYTDRMAQFDPLSETWQSLDSTQKARFVECQDDSAFHGDGVNTINLFATNGPDAWDNQRDDQIAWGQVPVDEVFVVYSANYLNWYFGPPVASTRLQVVKDVATQLLGNVNDVNVGLMRFNDPAEGGPVLHAMEDIETARSAIQAKINALPANGNTPLSETMYEAAQYYRGGAVDFGNLPYPQISVAESRTVADPNIYQSPLQFGCQKNFVVLLTDGAPTGDTSADTKITALPDFANLVGADCDGEGNGRCLDDVAEWLYEADLRPDLQGRQNVVTYTIGFDVDLPILASTAARGGGAYYQANNTQTLATVLTDIVTGILDTQTTFTSPAVSVNSFNRTQNLNDLFVTVFEPSTETHWPGNLKKYKLANGVITDANDNPAVDATTSFFATGARSFWSTNPDGPNVTAGGAANQLPDPAMRKLYTFLGDPLLTAPTNQIVTTNGSLNDLALGLGQPDDPGRVDIIDFARGVDVTDVDQDGITNEPRNQMGAPLHSKPVSVIYGGTAANPQGTVFLGTNDGYLHAIDPETGREKWAFIPPEFLPDLKDLYINAPTADKHYGIDGSIKVQIKADGDGVINPGAGEKVYLYFGVRRGGQFYYALDVTIPDQPKFLWRLDNSSLPGIGQSWSDVVPTRINIGSAAQNTDKLVLVIGGGYDATQDNMSTTTDTSGNSIYIVDSATGQRLWYASNSPAADLTIPKMQYSIPADIKVVDLDGDRFADRMYAADMGGQVLRFDIFNGQPAGSLVTGGVFAQLGAAGQAGPPNTEVRRFYYSPDIALVTDNNNSFLHVGIGSGHRARPNSEANRDRFYALRDYDVFNSKTQIEADFFTPITDADLVNVTDDINATVPVGSAGWRYELRASGDWTGEKVLAEARTFDNKVFFTTFEPGAAATANNCEPALGTNRLYALSIFNGAPVNNLDGIGDDDALTEDDRNIEFNGSIASEVVFIFPSPDDPDTCIGDQCTPPPIACVDLFCFPPGFDNAPVRTFWTQESVQ
jgi:type IV pilus assembly protein PilY1